MVRRYKGILNIGWGEGSSRGELTQCVCDLTLSSTRLGGARQSTIVSITTIAAPTVTNSHSALTWTKQLEQHSLLPILSNSSSFAYFSLSLRVRAYICTILLRSRWETTKMFGALLFATEVDTVATESIILSSVLLADCIFFALCHNDNIITPVTAPAITA